MTTDIPITADGIVFINKEGRLYLPHSHRTMLDVRDLICPVCGQGWEETAESLCDQHSMAGIPTPLHVQCWVRHVALEQRSRLQWSLSKAKIYGTLQPIPNEYWPSSYPDAGIPWYQARCDELGFRIVIGHRKRVISITLHSQGADFTDEVLQNLSDAFDGEDVTKDFSYTIICLHAWTDEKMDEYLQLLMNYINPPEPKGE